MKKLTPEEMILHAATRHELVYQQAMLILTTVADQFHKIRVLKLPKIVDFCLYLQRHNTN